MRPGILVHTHHPPLSIQYQVMQKSQAPPLNQSHSVSSASQMYKKVRLYTIPVHLAKSPNKKALYLARTCTHTPGVDHTVDQQVSKLELARVDATRGHRPS